MRINSGGNVGIGNTAPGYRLSVLFDANAQSQIQIANSNAGASATASIRLETQGNTWIINSNRNGGAFSIQDAASTRVWITNTGDVGIGTTSPTSGAKLDVVGAFKVGTGVASPSGQMLINSTSGTGATLQLFQDGVESWTISNPASSTRLAFSASGSERLTILTGGDVGIGTNSPGAPLDIRGANGLGVRYIETTTGNTNRIELGTASGFGYVSATSGVGSTALAFQVAGSELVRIAQTGSVGIGTTTPASGAKLDINGSAQTTPGSGGTITLYDANLSVNQRVIIGSDATGAYLDSTFGSGGTGVLLFKTVGTEKMRIAQGGNVSIGTTSTTSIFGTTVRAFNAGSGATLQLGGTTVNAYFYAAEGLGLSAIGNTTSTPFIFFTNDVERMRITAIGNIGLGTSDQFGGGQKVVGIANATTNPATNPTGGGVLYADGGALKWRGSSGTVTTIANA
jgi:hypothetical protein